TVSAAMSYFFFTIMLAIGAALIAGAIRKSFSRTEEAWTGTADRLRLAYHKKKSLGGRRKLEGEYHGYHVKVNTFTKSHGNGSSTYTRYTLFMESLGLGLELTQQHFLSGLSNAFTGGQDLTVGDEDFDKAVIVQSTSPVAMQKFLTRNRRMQIRKFLTGNRRARITDDEISYIHNGVVNEEGRLKAGLDTLVHLAQHFHQPVEAAATQDARPMNEVREVVRQTAKTEPRMADDMGAGVIAAQAAAAFLGREPLQREALSPTPEEVRAFEAARRTSPETEPVADSEPFTAPKSDSAPEPTRESPDKLAVEPKVEATTVISEAQDPSEASPASELVAYKSLRADLFESGMLSSEFKGAFAERFEGRSVEWSGKLRRIGRYSSDFVFEGSGSKAVVELEGVIDGSFTKGVQAIVQLPESAADEFGSAYDVPVTFTGTLHSCDGFLRDILVTAGEIKRAD
ncbi:MAG: hypothetical protein ACI9D0_001213, partial [Bacteroidia bacterium]